MCRNIIKSWKKGSCHQVFLASSENYRKWTFYSLFLQFFDQRKSGNSWIYALVNFLSLFFMCFCAVWYFCELQRTNRILAFFNKENFNIKSIQWIHVRCLFCSEFIFCGKSCLDYVWKAIKSWLRFVSNR